MQICRLPRFVPRTRRIHIQGEPDGSADLCRPWPAPNLFGPAAASSGRGPAAATRPAAGGEQAALATDPAAVTGRPAA